jgi:colanic acid biosynthesis glycosyl transferase WcaI
MRILILTQWFTPETSLLKPFAQGLIGRGHDVQVLTGFPNYPTGKVYPGYKIKAWQNEFIEGVPVLRVPLYPSHDSSAMGRIANYTSFAIASGTIGLTLSRPADVVYVYHPPATIGLPAVFFKWFRRTPFVYHIQDMWPDTLAATGMFNSKAGLALVDKWCRALYGKADRIVVISAGFKKLLLQRGVAEEKIDTVFNWCDEASINIDLGTHDEKFAGGLGIDKTFNILFAGTIGLAQALDAVLDAAALLKDRAPQARFVLVGGGLDADRLRSKAEEMKLENVLFLERRPIEEMGAVMSMADVLLVHLRDEPLFRITIPSKTQSYMWVGKPILMGVKGDARDLVSKAKAGISCEPENPTSIADAVEKLCAMPREELAAMGVNGRKFYERELSLAVAVEKFEKIFESVVRS